LSCAHSHVGVNKGRTNVKLFSSESMFLAQRYPSVEAMVA
jgi:hypothetical protein